MHEQWQDLIPFYVAGTLPKADMVALEQHLRDCESCNRSLREWRSISEGVRAEAEAWSKPLPPLSLHVRNNLYQQIPQVAPSMNGNHMPTRPNLTPVTTPQRRQTWSIATLAASIAILILFGGLLIYMANRLSRNPQEIEPLNIVGLSTVIPEVVTGIPTTAAPPSPTPTLMPTTSVPVVLSPVSTAVLPPTITPIPSQPDVNTMSAAATGPMIDVRSANQGCIVQNNGDTPIDILNGPGIAFQMVIAFMPGESANLTARSENGWYRVHIEGSWAGWVDSSLVTTSGDCDSLPVLSASTN